MILSRVTRQPFVICDPETFNDQVWIFESKEDLEKEAKPLAERKNPVAAIKVENKSFLHFYTTLYTLGVNSVVFYEKDKKTEIELVDIVKKPDFSALPKEKQPVFNPQLQLSGIYFMQELRRGVETKEKEGIVQLEEEFAANLVRSRYLVAVQQPKEGEDRNNMQIPYVQNQNGDIFQPVFTDPEEFRKFNKEQKLQAFAVEFTNLEQIMIPAAKGFVVNPLGFNAIVQKEQLAGLKQRFQVIIEGEKE